MISEIGPRGAELPPSFDSPESSTIIKAHYDSGQHMLLVTFVGDRTYRHSGVSPELWKDFYEAISKGTFYNQHIRSQFAGVIQKP